MNLQASKRLYADADIPLERPQDFIIAKLNRLVAFDDDDVAAIQNIRCLIQDLEILSYVIREGDRPYRCGIILNGYACRHKETIDGGRQITAVLMPGDFTDLQQFLFENADHSVQALSMLKVASMDLTDLKQLLADRPKVARAMWLETMIEGSMAREALLNNGRRKGPARIAHLLCEFRLRLLTAGIDDMQFDFPLTQEQIGDAVGLTAVHTNRSLRLLEQTRMVERNRRARKTIRILDWPGLQEFAGFNPRYLHLDAHQTGLTASAV